MTAPVEQPETLNTHPAFCSSILFLRRYCQIDFYAQCLQNMEGFCHLAAWFPFFQINDKPQACAASQRQVLLGQTLAFARVTDQCTDAGWCFIHANILYCYRSVTISQFKCQIKKKFPKGNIFMLADLKTKIMPVRECLVPAPYRVTRSAESLTVPILEYLQSSRSKRKMTMA
jgi:hypothetical protein